METRTQSRPSLPRFAPYDPAESPGPIPSVIERFRPRPFRPGDHDPHDPEAELRRHTVVLVTPEHAGTLGFDRTDVGFKLYVDDEWDCDLPHLDDAIRHIEEECGIPAALVEHHADLTYWTAHRRQ